MPFVTVSKDKLKEDAKTDIIPNTNCPIVYMKIFNKKLYRVRILPGWTDKGPYACRPYIRVWQHWNLQNAKFPINCPHHMSDGIEPCYICDQVKMLRQTGDEKDKELAGKIKAQRSFLYQVIDRADPMWKDDDEKIEGNEDLIDRPKVKILSLRITAHRQITSIISVSMTGDITDPSTGRDIEIQRTGKKGSTKTSTIPAPNPSYIFEKQPAVPDEELMMDLEEMIIPLDKHPYFQPSSYLQTRAAMTGEKVTDLQKAQIGPPQPQAQLNPPQPQAPAFDQARRAAISQGGEAKTGQDWVDEGIFGHPEQIWCYSLQPSPLDEYCWDCKMVRHCLAIFQKNTGQAYFEGPPLAQAPRQLPPPQNHPQPPYPGQPQLPAPQNYQPPPQAPQHPQQAHPQAPPPHWNQPPQQAPQPPHQNQPQGRNLNDVTEHLTQKRKKFGDSA